MPLAIAKVCRGMRLGRLAFETATMTVAELAEIQKALPKVELTGTGGLVEEFRAQKDKAEIRLIRQAIEMAEAAFQRFRKSLFRTFRNGLLVGDSQATTTEKAAADWMELCLRLEGAERSSFETIIAVGPHAA